MVSILKLGDMFLKTRHIESVICFCSQYKDYTIIISVGNKWYPKVVLVNVGERKDS